MLDPNEISYILNGIGVNINTIKTIFIILCAYYTNFRITNTKIIINRNFIWKIILVIIISIICGLIRYHFNYLISLLIAILGISVMFSPRNLINGALTTIISFGINYIAMAVNVFISFVISITLQINNNYFNLLLIMLIHIVIMYNIFKIKKLKYGIAFLQKKKENEHIDILILNVSIIILVITTIIVNSNVGLGMELFPYLVICVIIMFITIQKSLQLYYKQKLLVKELEETKEQLANKENEIKELEAENINISKKAHTLSHKQKSLQNKLDEMLLKQEISTEEAAEVRERLKEIEKDLYKEKAKTKLNKTGITQIDDMLSYLQKECDKNNIDFELQLNGNIHYMTNNLISKEDLETLLADHITNAIIAIKHTENINKSILVRLGEIEGIYSLYIYDSGIEFEKQTLENLGKKPSTTHANEGGTGMGFMNTFDTLRKCQASLTIQKFNAPSKENYTKAIIIKFDKRQDFKIITYKNGDNITDTKK